MKAIGGILVALGAAVCGYAGIALMMAQGATVEAGGRQVEDVAGGYLFVPLVMGMVVLAAGVAMLVYGGKGIYSGRPPARPEGA